MMPPPIIKSFEADLKATEPALPGAENEEHCTVDKYTGLLFAAAKNVVLVSKVAPTQFVFATIWAVDWQ